MYINSIICSKTVINIQQPKSIYIRHNILLVATGNGCKIEIGDKMKEEMEYNKKVKKCLEELKKIREEILEEIREMKYEEIGLTAEEILEYKKRIVYEEFIKNL